MRPLLLASCTALVCLCCAEELAIPQTLPAASPEGTSSAWDGGPSPGQDTMVPEQITFFEYAVGGARLEDPLPMLIALHGKENRIEYVRDVFAQVHTPARLIVPRGVPFGRGYVWWDIYHKDNDPRPFALAAKEAARRMDGLVRKLVSQKPTLGKPVIAGFSQGAALTYALLVRDPDLMASVFTLSAFLPESLVPAAWPAGASRPPVHVFHGDRDTVIPIAMDRASASQLKALGLPVLFHEYPLLVHDIGPLETADILSEMDEVLRQESRHVSGSPSP